MTSDAAVGVKIAMKKMMKDFADLDTLKTRAYVETSLSGQVLTWHRVCVTQKTALLINVHKIRS